jgi:hypothetical protein
MSDQPLTFEKLAEFHRETILPDMRRVAAESEARLRNEMYSLHDSLLQKFARLETKAEVERLRVRVEALHDEIRRLDRRIGTSET